MSMVVPLSFIMKTHLGGGHHLNSTNCGTSAQSETALCWHWKTESIASFSHMIFFFYKVFTCQIEQNPSSKMFKSFFEPIKKIRWLEYIINSKFVLQIYLASSIASRKLKSEEKNSGCEAQSGLSSFFFFPSHWESYPEKS